MPLVVDTDTLSAVGVVTVTPRSWSASARRIAASSPDPPASSTVLTWPFTARSRWTRRSGAKTARTSACCGWSANSPSRSRGSTPVSVSRSVRPTSSLRPKSDSTGTADGFCRRVSSTSPAPAPRSAASAGDTYTPSATSSP